MESIFTEYDHSSSPSTTSFMNDTGEQYVSDTEALVMSVFLNVIAVLGIFGNSLVIVAVLFSRQLRTATNVFVIALSVTDLFVCLTLPFQTIALTSDDGWPLPDWLCASIGGITSICFGASVLLLVLIAINRYLVITQPPGTFHRFYSSRNLALMVCTAYLYPFIAFAVLPLAGIGKLGYTGLYRICFWDEDHELAEVNDYMVALTLIVSFVVIVVFYIGIYLFIRRHHRGLLSFGEQNGHNASANDEPTSGEQTEERPPTALSRNATFNTNSDNCTISESAQTLTVRNVINKREVAITKNLFIVICSFFVCMVPFSVSLALPHGASLVIFTGILLMSNVLINPIIYSLKHPTFKVVIRCMLRCQYADIPKPSNTLKKLLNFKSNRW